MICDKIETAIFEWHEWVKFIADSEKITIEEARKKVIWVTSGLPSKKDLEKNKVVETILNGLPESATKWLNHYNETLKTVDEADSPVEWIVSVAKLTEGWDVKRVFQIIPHERKAFNSRLLIAQVLGRGLRVPPSVKAAFPKEEITVAVNNHPSWYGEIKDLFNEILEIKERGSWGYDSTKSYDISLYNLVYGEKIETGQQTTGAATEFGGTFNFYPQKMVHEATASFKNVKDEWKTKQMSYKYQEVETRDIDTASRELYAYVQTYDATPDKAIAKKYSNVRLAELITQELENKKYDSSFLSKQNFTQAQYALAPLFRKAGEKTAIYQSKSENFTPLSMADFSRQSFSESGLMKEGYFYYDENTLGWYEREDERIWVEKNITAKDVIAQKQKQVFSLKGAERELLFREIEALESQSEKFIKVQNEQFKTPLNAVFVSYQPERTFMESLVVHSDKIDWFIKSPDKGFYSLPYQHEAQGTTHSKTHHFNPDFFLKVVGQDDIIVVEIKKKDDLDSKNKAKYRDAKTHFEDLNDRLKEAGINQRYHFKFLSDDGNDIGSFFQSFKNGEYPNWASKLMVDLER